ncbi:AraC family transcriptional regulator [Caulobacter mirabilis]|uniref:AraC family transcriptional regulator n=1 Tax=Caulobacter mirabilis TaxID=69666 RepID=A0A2D2AX57_9CAUL|nr:AraC family transcriptional regulator [Caulobacter mirabilis]ATQ42582.1 AraC family transcriptional regulator [Caulobacter mirabilis]
MPSADQQQSIEARLLRLLAYIHDNLDGDLSLDRLAEVACLSRFHWHRVFRAMTGETLADAIRRIRLIRAANALVLETAPMAEIAARYGYPNVASFSRAFSAVHGTSPGAFRARGVQLAAALRRNPGDNRMYPVTLETLPAARAAGVLHVGPYAEVGRAFQQLGGLIAARGLFPHVQAMIGVYHDAPGSKPDAELRAHAAVIIADGFPTDIAGLEYFDLAGGRYAVMTHQGPPATLAVAYEWLYGQWLPQSGEEPRDAPPIEVYLTDPRVTPMDQARTEVRLPLVSRADE